MVTTQQMENYYNQWMEMGTYFVLSGHDHPMFGHRLYLHRFNKGTD